MTEPAPGAAARLRWPACTLALVACSLVVELAPGPFGALSFERAAIARGEVWRLLTGHLVHGDSRLAVLDLTALAVFGVWVELGSRRVALGALLASALLSSLAVLLFTNYERYVGSSALVSGLLVAATIMVVRGSSRATARYLAMGVLVLFGVKIGLELAGAWPAALGGLPAGHEPAVAAHIGGALGGGLAAVVIRSRAALEDERGG